MNMDITSALLAQVLTASNKTTSSAGSSVNTLASQPVTPLPDTSVQQALQHIFSRLPVYTMLLPLLAGTHQGRALAAQLLPPTDPEKLKEWLSGRKSETALLNALTQSEGKNDLSTQESPGLQQRQHILLRLLALQKAMGTPSEYPQSQTQPNQDAAGREFQWNIPTGINQSQLIDVIVRNDGSTQGREKGKKDRWHISLTLPVSEGIIKAEAVYERQHLSLALTASTKALEASLLPATAFLEKRLALHGVSINSCSVTTDSEMEKEANPAGLSIRV